MLEYLILIHFAGYEKIHCLDSIQDISNTFRIDICEPNETLLRKKEIFTQNLNRQIISVRSIPKYNDITKRVVLNEIEKFFRSQKCSTQ